MVTRDACCQFKVLSLTLPIYLSIEPPKPDGLGVEEEGKRRLEMSLI